MPALQFARSPEALLQEELDFQSSLGRILADIARQNIRLALLHRQLKRVPPTALDEILEIHLRMTEYLGLLSNSHRRLATSLRWQIDVLSEQSGDWVN